MVGALRVNSGLSEVGKILAFMTYFTIILNALLSISRMFVMVSKAAASAGRIAQVLETADEREWTAWAPEEKERREPGPSETVPPHVSF